MGYVEKLWISIFKRNDGVVEMGAAPRGSLGRAAQQLLDEHGKSHAPN